MALENTPINDNSPSIKRNVIQPSLKEEVQESYLPMVHGKATDAIATMNSKDIVKNPLNDTVSVTSHEVKMVIRKFDEIAGTLGVSTHKLLSMALAVFTNQNHVGNTKRTLQDPKIFIPLREYASLCGYDVIEHETSTPEEAAKEHTRAENELKNARKKINKDLDLLYNSSLSWKEKVRGKEADFMDMRIISAKGIRKGYIYMELPVSMAEYLIQLPITQYPVSLLKLDERNKNAYSIGLQLTEHYNLDNNLIKGTAQLLKVSTILEGKDFPSINDPSVKKNGWVSRIKEPFEKSLDALTGVGTLEDWYYCHSKGVELTDEEADFKSYEDWVNTLVCFTLKDAPDHTARLEAREAERKEREEKAKTRAKRKTKKPAAKKKPTDPKKTE